MTSSMETRCMSCPRCHGLMCPVDLHDWESGTGQDHCRAFRCIVCGEIVDPQIIKSRLVEALSARQRKSRARHSHPVVRL